MLLSGVALELAVGRLEDAAADLDALAANSEPGVRKALGTDETLRIPLAQLTYQKLVFEGNYAEAGAAMESLHGRLIGVDPNKALREQFVPKNLADGNQPLVALWPSTGLFAILRVQTAIREAESFATWGVLAPLTVAFAPSPLEFAVRPSAATILSFGYDKYVGFTTLRTDLQRRREGDAEFFSRRGMLSVFEGDIPAAKARFLQTRQPAEKEWGLPEYRHQVAERYLRLIEEAEKRSAKK